MASRPSHIYASTVTRRDRAWGRQRRRPLIAVATPLGLFAALSCSSLLGVVIQHVA